MSAPERVRSYDTEQRRQRDAEQRRQHRAARRAVREADTAQQIERQVRKANSRRHREVRTVRLPGGRVFALGVFACTDRLHPFVPDGTTGTTCQLCFGWSSDYRHTTTAWAVTA